MCHTILETNFIELEEILPEIAITCLRYLHGCELFDRAIRSDPKVYLASAEVSRCALAMPRFSVEACS